MKTICGEFSDLIGTHLEVVALIWANIAEFHREKTISISNDQREFMVIEGEMVDLLEVSEDRNVLLHAIFAISVFEVRVLCVLAILVLLFTAPSKALNGVLLVIYISVSRIT